jgi:NADH-quinone oxidoreductase subunit N
VALALLGSFISLYYYLAVLKAIFVDDPDPRTLNPEPLPLFKLDFLERASLSVLGLVVLLLGVFPDGLITMIVASLSPLQ